MVIARFFSALHLAILQQSNQQHAAADVAQRCRGKPREDYLDTAS